MSTENDKENKQKINQTATPTQPNNSHKQISKEYNKRKPQTTPNPRASEYMKKNTVREEAPLSSCWSAYCLAELGLSRRRFEPNLLVGQWCSESNGHTSQTLSSPQRPMKCEQWNPPSTMNPPNPYWRHSFFKPFNRRRSSTTEARSELLALGKAFNKPQIDSQ